MSQRTPAPALMKTPIERIFEKVMSRKMTAEEREALQLNIGEKSAAVEFASGTASSHKNETKATAKRAAHTLRSFSAAAGIT